MSEREQDPSEGLTEDEPAEDASPEDEEVVESPPKDLGTRIGEVIGYLLAVPFMVFLAALALSVPAAVVYAIVQAFPDDVPQKNDAGWIELIMSNQFVVFAARIVLILLVPVLVFGGVYLTVSIFVRMFRKEWLHKAGPFEAAVAKRAEKDLQAVEETYAQMLDDAWTQNEDLGGRLELALGELEAVTAQRDWLDAELARREGGPEA
jgi:hypothetical protein